MSRRLAATWLLVAVPVGALVLSLVATRHGAGIVPDSMQYLGAARNLRAGRGLTIPFSRPTVPIAPLRGVALYGKVPYIDQPPLFPVALAAAGRLFGDDVRAARLLNAWCFAGSMFLVGLLALRATRSRGLAVASQVATIAGPSAPLLTLPWTWFVLSGVVLTESLESLLSLGAIALLLLALEGKRYMFELAVVAATGAVATRWGGVAVAATGAVVLLAWTRWSWRARFSRAAIFAGIPTAFGLAVLLWNHARLPTTSRNVRLHMHASDATALRTLFADWFAPSRAPAVLQLIVIATVVSLATRATTAAVRILVRSDTTANDAMWAITRVALAALVCATLVVVLAAHAFVDASIALDARQFSCAVPALYILVFAGVTELPRVAPYRRQAAAVLTAALVAMGAGTVVRLVRDGHGYSGVDASATDVTQAVRALPPGTFVFSNRADVVYRVTGRPALLVPVTRNVTTDLPNRDVFQQICDMGNVVMERNGVIVFFANWFDPVVDEPTVGHFLGLRDVMHSPAGSIATVTRGCTPGSG